MRRMPEKILLMEFKIMDLGRYDVDNGE